MPKEEYLRWVAMQVEKAITTFRPHMVFYISGSSPTDPTQGNPPPNLRISLSLSLSLFAITTCVCVCVCVCAGEAWVVDRDALVFRLAVDTHSIPLVCAHAYDQSHQGRVGLARH
jgi:hypothetical protein